MTRLNEVRDDHTTYNNRLDTTLADVFNLLSLFFLLIGKTRECPATYSQIASMRVSATCTSDTTLALGPLESYLACTTWFQLGLIVAAIAPMRLSTGRSTFPAEVGFACDHLLCLSTRPSGFCEELAFEYSSRAMKRYTWPIRSIWGL